MKKIVYILLISFASFKLAAQPIITTSILPVIGDTIKIGVDTLLVAPGVPGVNITWDFKSLPLHYASSRIYLNPSITAFFNFAPAATMARTDAQGAVYSFWKNTVTTSTYYGFVELNKYDQNFNSLPIGYYKFPITFGQNYMDSFSAFTNPGSVTGAGKYYFSADGWGTLILPHKTVSNTLRTKSVLYIGDSTINNYSLTVEYAWYLEGKKDPLLVVSSVVINKALYKKFALYDKSSGAGISEMAVYPVIKIYPNPSKNAITLERFDQAGNDLVNLKIFDAVGKFIEPLQIEKGLDQQQIDISQYPSGLYFVEILANEKLSHQKFLKE